MDSGNSSSGSLHSSSGGEDAEEYDSISRSRQLLNSSPPNFMNHPQAVANSIFSNQNHHQSLMFDPSPNSFFQSFLNHPEIGVPSSSSSSNFHNQLLRSAGPTVPMPPQSSSPSPPTPPHAMQLLRSANHHNHHDQNPSIITAPTPAPISDHHDNNPNQNQNQNQNQQRSSTGGHVTSRNPKKRTRASRRAPTTVLTTDTSNFRAMVQEFTGIPAPPFSASPYSRGSSFDLFRGGGNSMDAAAMSSLLYPLRPSQHKLHHRPLFGASSFNQIAGNSNSSDLHQMNQMLSPPIPSPSAAAAGGRMTSLDVDHHHHQQANDWGSDHGVVGSRMASSNDDHRHVALPTTTTTVTTNVEGGFMFQRREDHDDHKDLENLTNSSRPEGHAFDSWICPTND